MLVELSVNYIKGLYAPFFWCIMNTIRYCQYCGKQILDTTVICPNCGSEIAQKGKNKIVAALLAIFLGGFGIHKFYLAKPFQGVFYLLFCWTGIPSIIAFIEGILYLIQSNEKFSKKYN